MTIKVLSVITKLKVGEWINWTKSRAGLAFQIRKISLWHAIPNIIPSNIYHLAYIRKKEGISFVHEIGHPDIPDATIT